VVLALSNSGETDEVLAILPIIKRLGVPLIAMTGNPQSTLAKFASVHINENDILQEKLKKTEPESDQPDNLDVKVEVPVNEVAGEAKPPVTDAHEVVEKAKE